MKASKFLLPFLLLFLISFCEKSYSQKKTKIISVGTMISRISAKPFNFNNGLRPGIRPMFEYQVEKNIFGGFNYSYGIGYKGLAEHQKHTIKNLKYYDIKYTNLGESLMDGWRIDTLFTYTGNLTDKNQTKLAYIYFPVGIIYYSSEKLSFGIDYSLAYVWSGKFNTSSMYSDVPNNYNFNYSASIDLPGSKQTNDKYVHRWDHWVRMSVRYKHNDYLFRIGFERGLRNMFTAKTIPGTDNGKPTTFYCKDIIWQNTSIFLSVGINLPNY